MVNYKYIERLPTLNPITTELKTLYLRLPTLFACSFIKHKKFVYKNCPLEGIHFNSSVRTNPYRKSIVVVKKFFFLSLYILYLDVVINS